MRKLLLNFTFLWLPKAKMWSEVLGQLITWRISWANWFLSDNETQVYKVNFFHETVTKQIIFTLQFWILLLSTDTQKSTIPFWTLRIKVINCSSQANKRKDKPLNISENACNFQWCNRFEFFRLFTVRKYFPEKIKFTSCWASPSSDLQWWSIHVWLLRF